MRIVFLPEVLDYFNDLTTILYEREYFGLEETAVRYVNELLDDICATLPSKVSKLAPSYFNRYGKGMRYATFRKNKVTQWYVFFTKYQDEGGMVYMIRYITNNHVNAQYL